MATTGYISDYPSLPFGGADETALECSYQGAKGASLRAGSQALRLLTLYRERGPHTDHEATEALGLPLATICARRNWLISHNWVKSERSKPGPFGTPNAIWELA